MASVAQIIRRRRARRERQRQQHNTRRTLIWILTVVIGGLVILPLGAAGAVALSTYSQLSAGLPIPQTTIEQDSTVGASQLYDRSGQTLLWSVEDPLGSSRTWIRLDELPPYLLRATLLREDPDFLRTASFNPLATAQDVAAYALQDAQSKGPLPPDPTLTGRLVRNAIAPPPDGITNDYRLREYALVLEINRLYTPEEVLEWHLNTSYYGSDAYGVDAAAQVYFGKRAADLTLDEAAMIAAIPTAPQYNPAEDLVAARGRQSEVLRDLLLDESITQAQFSTANETLTPVIERAPNQPQIAPEYTLYARRQAESILDSVGYNGSRLVSRGGLRITTALDLNLYEQIDCTLQSHLSRLTGEPPPVALEACPGTSYLPPVQSGSGLLPDTGAVALVNVRTGELLATVGEVTRAAHQPGPVLRPFVYFRSFSSQPLYTPASMVLDIPQRLSGAADGLIYTPTNPDGSFNGPVNLRDAMSAGLLPPAVEVAEVQGLENVLRTAGQIGLRGLANTSMDLSLLERGGAVSVLDATYAYSVFAGGGSMRGVPAESGRSRDPVAVLRIEDAEGQLLWAYEGAERELAVTPIMDTGLSYLVNNILSDPAPRARVLGTGNIFELSRPAAVVYGAAGGGADLWTVGYSPNLAVGVWLGRQDAAAVNTSAWATDSAAPVWRAVMAFTHDIYGMGPDDWPRPQNITEARVCERSGLRANNNCPSYVEIFLEGTQPPESDRYWQSVTVNSQNGLLATANTPTNLREDRVFFVPPPQALEWWEAQQLPLPPEEYDTVTRPELVQSTVILRPALLDYVSGMVDIRGSMDAEALQYFQLAYGQGLNPDAWTDITGQQTVYTPGQSLAQWDTTGLDGLYNLRLTAVLEDNSIDPYIIQVTVDNIAPTVDLITENRPFTFLNDRVIPLMAQAEDNVAIDRVEFYLNGEFVGTDDTFPFGYEHEITRVGEETFSAVVFDKAGNQANSELTVNVGRGGT